MEIKGLLANLEQSKRTPCAPPRGFLEERYMVSKSDMETMLRILRKIEVYNEIAKEYGLTVENMLTLAKSQISTVAELRKLEAKIENGEYIKKDQWVSVDEKPKTNISVAVILNNGNVTEGFYSITKQGWFKDTGFLIIPNVIYWAYLP